MAVLHPPPPPPPAQPPLLAFGTPLGSCVVVPLRGAPRSAVAPPPGHLSAAARHPGLGRDPRLLGFRVKEAPLSAHTRSASGPGGGGCKASALTHQEVVTAGEEKQRPTDHPGRCRSACERRAVRFNWDVLISARRPENKQRVSGGSPPYPNTAVKRWKSAGLPSRRATKDLTHG